MLADRGGLAQHQVSPDRADNAHRDADQEDQPPAIVRQDAAQDQADHRAENSGDLVNAQRQAALVGGKGVGEDRGTIGEEEAGTDRLNQPEHDQLNSTSRTRARR